MSRLSRKNRTNSECGIKTSGGITDLFDNVIKSAWRIDDEEYESILEKMTDEEMGLFLTEKPTFEEKRKMIILVERLLNLSEYRDSQIKKII
jgi:predicted house-cleaning noncanonical NTP pyrophosphatase (MazG superfamily)